MSGGGGDWETNGKDKVRVINWLIYVRRNWALNISGPRGERGRGMYNIPVPVIPDGDDFFSHLIFHGEKIYTISVP